MAFEVIPAIDLRAGKCVRLFQGDFARETVYGDDPAAMALRWRGEGAGRLHVVDLDGARTGIQVNLAAVHAIVEAAGIPVQAGGGLRSLDAVAALLDAGVSRVVIGTAAVEDEAFVAEAVRRHGEAVVIGVDARGGMAATQGWERQESVAAVDLIGRMRALGASRFVYTDIARDGALTGPNVEALRGAIDAAAPRRSSPRAASPRWKTSRPSPRPAPKASSSAEPSTPATCRCGTRWPRRALPKPLAPWGRLREGTRREYHLNR